MPIKRKEDSITQTTLIHMMDQATDMIITIIIRTIIHMIVITIILQTIWVELTMTAIANVRWITTT
jgi:hypothetical protein